MADLSTDEDNSSSNKGGSSNSNNDYQTTNDNDTKPSRIHVKKPLSTTSFLQNNSPTNGFSNHLKKRTLQLNNFFYSNMYCIFVSLKINKFKNKNYEKSQF
jgi:hypothetical protein